MIWKEKKELRRKARELRNNMTKAEIILWSRIRSRKINGYKFRRQQPILEYIVDFYCHELKLIIEVDGEIHSLPSQIKYDKYRDKMLKNNGYYIVHFTNHEIETNLNLSLAKIKTVISEILSPSQGGSQGINIMNNNNLNKDLSPFQEANRGSSYKSSVVLIGSVPLGGTHPVRLQSMTNTDTLDTKATVAQCIKIVEAGADFVRLAAQGVREAQNLENIREELRKAGFSIPLIADIHFNPAAAETAAKIVEKIRINPGNYADKRVQAELSEKEYEEELERIHDRLLPLIGICRLNSTVIRIGINQGSLSNRIMTRYGNTPKGMVLSAMEFIRIFRSENFKSLVLSMKSSDTGIMVEANRMLINMMQKEGVAYPIHLGVTEAGEGEDGRVQSAAGIGALLSEGIGDTIRVSLTEDPEREIPVAKEILHFLGGSKGRVATPVNIQNFKLRDISYKPEVITYKDGRYLSEDGKPFHGEMFIFNYKTPPVLPEQLQKKVFLSPVFAEDDPEKLVIDAAALLGRYFILKQADGICITNRGKVQGKKLKDLSFSILQATEARITRNRYISCPTCGRTKFNLQDTVKKVKAATGHLKGLKIAVMGCVVNGPGEMAGADYGYVGAGKGKVHIYRGMTPVLKNIPEKDAIDKLLKLIEEDQ